MKIIQATRKHSGILAKILSDWKDEMDWLPDLHTRSEDQRFLNYLIDSHNVTIAKNWRGVLGFLARDKESVHSLYLAQAARGRGIGKMLLDDAKQKVARLELWAFQQNTRAIAFYTREGFTEVERTDGAGNDEKLPDVRMVWNKS